MSPNPEGPRCTGRVKVKLLGDDGEPVRDDDGHVVHERDERGEIITRSCINAPIRGGTVCHAHGGRAPQVKAKAAVRAELASWGLGDSKEDPGELLLRLMSQSSARVVRYSAELEDLVEQHGGDIQAAMIADSMMLDRDGNAVKVGEYVRGLARLEADERDRCAGMATKAIAAGLAKRQVELAEREAEMVIGAVNAALEAAGVPAGERGPAKIAAARHLRLA